ncbi:MAG: DUF1659 domain-containing protein [Firmicutes bacterium]|jgi:hypothetical protein|nr:DUF1659 domain-containing protein [Bacillota bacterium]
MAVQRIPELCQLQLRLQTGTDEGGKPVVRARSFTNVKVNASDQDIYDVGQALASLQIHPLVAVRRIDTGALNDIA